MSETPQAGAVPAYQTPILEHFPSLFRNRNFLLLWGGYVVSALGDRIHFLVMLKLLEMLKQHRIGTQETAQLNVMMLAPFLVLGPFTGVIADRLPRRTVMITSDFARVIIVILARTLFLALPAALHQSVPWMPTISYAVLLLLISELILAAFSAFFSPARTALLPNLVHPDQLLRANALTNAAGTIASLVGFIVGAILVRWHLGIAMYIDAGTFLTSGILLLFMTRTARVVGRAIPRDQRSSIFGEFRQGLNYLLAHKRALQVVMLMFLFWCAGAIILSGLTGIVTKKFNMSVDYFGIFLGIVGIGMMVGAAAVSLSRHGIPKEFGIAWAMALVGLFLFLFSVPEHWPWALAFLVIGGFFSAILMVSLDTLLQRIVPDFIRGRVMAIRDMVANVGLVGVAVPLAISTNIDDYILFVLRVLAIGIVGVGLWLVSFYYRRQSLPTPASIMLRFVRGYLSLVKHLEAGTAARIPTSGPTILVANHTTAYDPLVMQVTSKYRLIQFMMAKEYYEKKPFLYLYKAFGVIPVNRTGNDTASFRTALRVLKDGGCIGMYPEGKISDDGRMDEGRPGVALLALMSGATVVPAYIAGTNVHAGMVKDFLIRSKVTIYFGRPLRFDDLKILDRDAGREIATKRIMDAIIALRDRYETNPERRMSTSEARAREGGAGAGIIPAAIS
ncbi:MAG TPA: MFS transporter [Phycisphaerae bacterium]|nr:MFS transporter [Phycisphaerae bacterium]